MRYYIIQSYKRSVSCIEADYNLLVGDVYTIELDVPQSDYMGGRIVSITTWESDKGCAQVVNGKDLINEPDPANNPDNNIIFKAAGRYAVTYNETSGEISIEKK